MSDSTLRVLAVADVEERALWSGNVAERFSDVDLILAAGDLDADYLEFLVTIVNKPLLYVHGNHDERYVHNPPQGCICVDDGAYVYRGLRIVGLGGSRRYREGTYMYTERQMRRRIRKVSRQVKMLGGVDLLLCHAPVRGVGDLDDIPHQGFESRGEMVERWHPQYLVHGHVHEGYTANFRRERTMGAGTKVINAFGHVVLDVSVGQLSYGWKQSLVNRHTLKVSDELTAQEEGVLGAGWSYLR